MRDPGAFERMFESFERSVYPVSAPPTANVFCRWAHLAWIRGPNRVFFLSSVSTGELKSWPSDW